MFTSMIIDGNYIELTESDNDYLKQYWCAWYYDYIDNMRYDNDITDIPKRKYCNVDFLVLDALRTFRNNSNICE